jgi:general nucleoside transport system permease protein
MMWQQIFTEALLVGVLAASVRTASPILLAALGEIFAELSGVINVGLEGQMLVGALAGFLGAYYLHSNLAGAAAGALAGGLIALILAFMCITLHANQVVTGVTINVLCLGLTTFAYRALFGVSLVAPSVDTVQTWRVPVLVDIPYLGPVLFEQKPFVYFTLFLVLIAAWLLYRTTIGAQVRAVGENPAAAETMGLNIYKTRTLSVIVAGMAAGLGGAFLSVGEVGSFTYNMTSGRGFMALAIVIFGGWNPWLALVAALLFGAADALQLSLQALGVALPSELLLSVPYVLTLLIVAVAWTKSRAPAALGSPYVKE